MRIFVSYSHQDKPVVDQIVTRLKADGHDVWIDSLKLRPGDNIQRKIAEGLEEADAFIVVVSENSFRSKSVQHEFAAIALQQISKRQQRIIPIRIDQSAVPSYLADRIYLDLSDNLEDGLERLSRELRAATPDSIVATLERVPRTAEGKLPKSTNSDRRFAGGASP